MRSLSVRASFESDSSVREDEVRYEGEVEGRVKDKSINQLMKGS